MFSLVFADSYTVAVMILVTWFGANENQNFTLSRRYVLKVKWEYIGLMSFWFRNALLIIFVIWILSAGVASLPLTGLIGQYGYHPNRGCELLRCNTSYSGSEVPFYLIFFMGFLIPGTATLITSILIFKQLFCYCFSNPNFCTKKSQNFNLKDHFIFAVSIILYTCFTLLTTCIESFVSIPSYSGGGFIFVGIFSFSFIYIRMYILMSPKCKEMLSFLFRDIDSVVNNSKSISMSNYESGNNVSKCRVNSLK